MTGGVKRLPEHMQEAAAQWVERGFPHPDMMGSFLHAVLENDLIAAFSFADEANTWNMKAWAMWLYNDVPEACRGSREKMLAWHARGGLAGHPSANGVTQASER